MNKTTSKKRVWCSSIALIPVFIAAICVFSTKTIAQHDMNVLPDQTKETVEIPVQGDNRMITPGKGASPEQMEEFRKIISKYFDINREPKWINYSFSGEDKDLLYAIYVQMDENQREDQCVRFAGPFTTGPRIMTSTTWKNWNNPNKGKAVWIDGEKIDLTTLASYSRIDFAYYAYNNTDEKQERLTLYLWTKKGFEDYLQQNSQQISIAKLLEIPPQVYVKYFNSEQFNHM